VRVIDIRGSYQDIQGTVARGAVIMAAKFLKIRTRRLERLN